MKKIYILLGIVFLLSAALIILEKNKNKSKPSSALPKTENEKTHFAYFMQSEFYSGILRPQEVTPVQNQVPGAIVSHHFYMEREIAKLFSKLASQTPETIVVVGPNHFSAGYSNIQVSQLPYDTPWGIIEPDKKFISAVLRLKGIEAEEKTFEREHSISTLVGFVKFSFPNAKIVPIVLKRNMKITEAEDLAKFFHEQLPRNSIVLASVDFSHHVTNKQAQKQDRETLPLLKNFEYEKLMQRKPEEIDSPVTLITLLKFLELKGAKKMDYFNTNQALVSGNLDNPDVTSYFFATFTK